MKTESFACSSSDTPPDIGVISTAIAPGRGNGCWLALILAWLSILNVSWAQTPPVLTLSDYSPGDGATLILEGTNAASYNIEYTSSLNNSTWLTLPGGVVIDDAHIRVVDAGAGAVSQRYYRAHGTIFSVNMVGFNKLSMPTGYSHAANAFRCTNEAISAVLPSVPNGTLICKPTGGGVSWDFNSYVSSQGWSNPDMQLRAGEAFWFYNPGPGGTVIFKGEIPTGTSSFGVGAGFSLCTFFSGSMNPGCFSGSVIVYRYNPITSEYALYQWDPDYALWDPMEPSLQFGDVFILHLQHGMSSYCEGRPFLMATPISSLPDLVFAPNASTMGQGQVVDNLGHPLAGCSYQGQLYAGTNRIESAMVAVGAANLPTNPPVCFLTGAHAGIPPAFIFRSGFNNPLQYFQFRVWDTNGGSSYEAASLNGAPVGKSAIFGYYNPGTSPFAPPAVIPAFYNFSISGPLVTIISSPQSQTVRAGEALTLTVGASGQLPLSYQWQLNGTNIPNATDAAYSVANPQCADSGSYTVVVTNPTGTILSPAATVSLVQMDANCSLTLCGPIGAQYRIEWNNLLATNNWQVLSNLTLLSSPFLVPELNAGQTEQRFFRTVKLP